jgi:IclR family acetate operon transcriptional repressor
MVDAYIVKPVAKALQTLMVLGEANRDLSLAELCHRVGIPKTTVFRYLQTLVAHGFVRHDPQTDRYGLGLRLWDLGQLVGANMRLREVALPPMEMLRDRFDETVNLGVLDGKDIVYMEMAESRKSLRMQARLGGRDPVYTTSLGRAMLAFLPDERWSDHLPARLAARTSRTISSLPALRSELMATRARGYAIDNGENEADARCIGAPIWDRHAEVIGAVSLSAPASRFDQKSEDEVAAAVIGTARQISRRLGFDE